MPAQLGMAVAPAMAVGLHPTETRGTDSLCVMSHLHFCELSVYFLTLPRGAFVILIVCALILWDSRPLSITLLW